jgi:hypothetical protein
VPKADVEAADNHSRTPKADVEATERAKLAADAKAKAWISCRKSQTTADAKAKADVEVS